MLQIVRAGNSYPGTSGSPWFRPREEESGERAAWLNGPVQERARDLYSIDRLRERERERERERDARVSSRERKRNSQRRRKGREREKGARDIQERLVERRGHRSDRQQQARFRLIARRPSRAARVITDLVENGTSPVRYPGALRFYYRCCNPLSIVIRLPATCRRLYSMEYMYLLEIALFCLSRKTRVRS